MSVTSTSKTFLVTYRYDGAEWVIELKARDVEDAKARLAVLPFARLDGELIATVPAALGVFATVAVAVRNGLRKLVQAGPLLREVGNDYVEFSGVQPAPGNDARLLYDRRRVVAEPN